MVPHRSPNNGLSIECLRSRPSRAHIDGWDALQARPPASVCGSFSWVNAALDYLHQKGEPLILLILDGTRLVGSLPLICEMRHGVPTVRLVGDPLNDLADARLAVDCPGAARALLTALEALSANGAHIHLTDLDPDGHLVSVLRGSRVFRLSDAGDAPVIDLNTWPALSRNFDKNLRRCERMLRAQHHVTFRWQRPDPAGSLLADLLRLRSARFRQTGAVSELPEIESEPGFRFFLQSVSTELGAQDRCGIATLCLDGIPVARDLYIADQRTAMLFLRGMNPQWHRYSCGHLLLKSTVTRLAKEGCTTLDLGRGDEAYKYRFGANSRRLVTAVSSDDQTLTRPLGEFQMSVRRS